MSKLCINLPPFAPDYSGAASALFDMGGMIVIHDASGCTGNYTGFDEPRWFNSGAMVYCSGLRHLDAVLGNDSKFIDRIAEAAKSLNPKFIAVLGSPVPMVIGTDFDGIAKEIEALTGIPSIGILSNGLNYYIKGINEASLKIMKKLINEDCCRNEKNGINIIGMTPLDFYTNNNDSDFINLFQENGIEVQSCFFMGLTVEKLNKSVNAALNVVVSQSGIETAKYMEKRFGIPYIAVTPLGDGILALEEVKNAMQGNYVTTEPIKQEARTIIIGDEIISNSIRKYLQYRCGYGGIDVASLFCADEKYQFNDDFYVKDEYELRKILNSGKYKAIIADPLIKQLIKNNDVNFYEMPHVAVSSKVYWDKSRRLLDKTTENWLKTIKE